MLCVGKIFRYLHNVYEAAHLQVDVTEFNLTFSRIFHLYLFMDKNKYIYYNISIRQ